MARTHKKNLIINYKNLPEEIRDLFKEAYPEGYKDFLQRTVKPSGESIFTVPLETDDTFYLVKFDVKIDSGMVEEDDDAYSSDGKDDDDSEFVPISEALEKEEGTSTKVGPIRHGGDYDNFLSEVEEKPVKKKIKHNSDVDDDSDEELMEDEDFDQYLDEDEDDKSNEEPEGPSDKDLMEIDQIADDLIKEASNLNVQKITNIAISSAAAAAARSVSAAAARPKEAVAQPKAKEAVAQPKAKGRTKKAAEPAVETAPAKKPIGRPRAKNVDGAVAKSTEADAPAPRRAKAKPVAESNAENAAAASNGITEGAHADVNQNAPASAKESTSASAKQSASADVKQSAPAAKESTPASAKESTPAAAKEGAAPEGKKKRPRIPARNRF